MHKENNNGDNFSPCRTQPLQVKNSDEKPFIHVFCFFLFYTFVHIFFACKTFNIFSTFKKFVPEHISP